MKYSCRPGSLSSMYYLLALGFGFRCDPQLCVTIPFGRYFLFIGAFEYYCSTVYQMGMVLEIN